MSAQLNKKKAIEESIFVFGLIGGLVAFASALAAISTVALIS